MKYSLALTFYTLFILSCSSQKDANTIIQQAIKNAGGEKYENSTIDFDFRDHHYQVERSNGDWYMRRTKEDESKMTEDFYTQESFERRVNDSLVQVEDSMAYKYQESINSVIYFALLPYKLNDPAVKKKMLADESIEGNDYYKIEIRFEEEDGGVDYQDVFIYWLDKQDLSLDYLAYSFQTDGGGLRFRKAYNERIVGGIRFVDYINYKAAKENELNELAKKFESKELEELSRIELKNIKVN